MKYETVTKPRYRAIGMKWDGPWSEISGLKSMIQTMSERVGELTHAVDPDTQLGLSYHLRPDGFVHYSVYEVGEEQTIPEGMIEFFVPEMTYLVTQHEKGQNIGQSYDNIARSLSDSEYKAFSEADIKYFDNLPIKHERYPRDRDLNDPHFEILIPIARK
ncbi:transcriptional regulator [Anaerobacillus alkaliphilus]|uniref:Transcriptional regulator n=1 Tax=Anaerobacillus alkaliphilus TaxID=1548597 RepID=A0A4Q0VMK7_9BACI|nr:GyrI-like domain-containing protein [Anaerobacillus alkaliphilus]RXI96637.1 transcriptional regulator [Anaerobacillus alkaliphilus]